LTDSELLCGCREASALQGAHKGSKTVDTVHSHSPWE
jgi:hypothetical protein